MNQLEHLKAIAWKQHVKDMDKFAFRDAQRYKDAFNQVIEHTHTQTIQSVREMVAAKMRETDIEKALGDYAKLAMTLDGGQEFAIRTDQNNRTLTDLLKDLEAPVEGDVASEPMPPMKIVWGDELSEGDNVN